jgi:hypothetical protein
MARIGKLSAPAELQSDTPSLSLRTTPLRPAIFCRAAARIGARTKTGFSGPEHALVSGQTVRRVAQLPKQTVTSWAWVSFRAGQTGTLREGSRRHPETG